LCSSVVALAFTAAGGLLTTSQALDYLVDTEQELRDALAASNGSAEADNIILEGDIVLASPAALPALNTAVTINTGNYSLTALDA
jgi:hypothetical protein